MQFVQVDQGGIIRHEMVDTPSDGARWDASTAPTCVIKDSGGGVLVASQSATLGASTTTDASVAADQKVIGVTSETGFEVDGRIWIGPNASGQWETAYITKVATGELTVADDLEYAYESSVTVASHTMSVTVTSAQATGPYAFARAEWTYSVDSVSRVAATQIHFSLYVPRHSVTKATIQQFDPASELVLSDTQSMRRYLDTIWGQYVLPDIFKAWDPGAVVDAVAMDQALIHRTIAEIQLAARDREGYEASLNEYRLAVDRGFQMTSIDADQSGGIDSGEKYQGADVGRVLRG